MVNKIDIKPATLISGSTVSVQILKYVDGSLSEDNTYTFDANDFESLMSASNPYVAILTFGTVHTENINGSTTQCFFDGVVCSPNDAYTLATLVDADVTAYASGGGGYTFPSNSGNTAYVSSGGNDGTGVVGNISKPFLTANAAIAALNNAVDGALIILSSTTQIDITDYETSSYPYSLTITSFANQDISCEGSCSFGSLTVKTPSSFIIDTRAIFTIDDIMNVECGTFLVTDTAEGAINMTGVIKCNTLNIAVNALVTISADVIEWSRTAIVGVTGGFTYNICPPKQWKAIISQTDTDAPTIDSVFKNTYGEAFSTDYISTGQYAILSAGNLFTVNKTQVYFSTSNLNTVSAATLMNKGDIAVGSVEIFSLDNFIGLADKQIKSLDITIETYL
jgi:hypothetical protein